MLKASIRGDCYLYHKDQTKGLSQEEGSITSLKKKTSIGEKNQEHSGFKREIIIPSSSIIQSEEDKEESI